MAADGKRRAPRGLPAPARRPRRAPDGDEFRLYASAMVHCAHCGALMRNLLVSGAKADEAPPQ